MQNDADLIESFNRFMADNPYASRHEVSRGVSAGLRRLQKMDMEGMIKLPPPMSKSIAATRNRKKYGIGKNWYINKPPEWDVNAR